MNMDRTVIHGRQLILFLLLSTLLATSISFSENDSNTPLVYTIEIQDVITGGTTNYIARSIEKAEEDNAAALVLLINTPGGLVDATMTILEDMMASDVPIITYVSPQGAIAASAGSFILVGGHVASMSPGTTTGAAMPITIGLSEEGTQTNTADEKTINFLAGHIHSVATEKGRNGEVIEKFVTENLTLNAQEALDENVIDTIAIDLDTLLSDIHDMTTSVNGKDVVLNTADAKVVPIGMTTREKATAIISNPQVSFLLVILGIYGLIIGFNAPQTYVPEVGGAIALMLGLYGLGMFEINLFAALMIILGVLLLIAEALTPTYGVLSVGGIISIIFGGLFLPREPLMPVRWFTNLTALVVGVGLGASILMIIALRAILRVRRKKVPQGRNEFADVETTVLDVNENGSLVKIQGEYWYGLTPDGKNVEIGQTVRIINRTGTKLVIQPVIESINDIHQPTDKH